MIAAVIQNFDVVDGTFAESMFSAALSALLNFVVTFLILTAAYYFPYRSFIKRIYVFNTKLYRVKLMYSSIFAAAISAAYNLAVLTVNTVEFVSKYSPIYTDEIAYIVYDYLFILVSSAVGAVVMYFSRSLYSSKKFHSES